MHPRIYFIRIFPLVRDKIHSYEKLRQVIGVAIEYIAIMFARGSGRLTW